MCYIHIMIAYKKLLDKYLKNPIVRREYERLGPEFELIEAVIAKRIEKKMTQKELAHKIGTKQSAIARLESGGANPSFAFLRKIADALGVSLHISFR